MITFTRVMILSVYPGQQLIPHTPEDRIIIPEKEELLEIVRTKKVFGKCNLL